METKIVAVLCVFLHLLNSHTGTTNARGHTIWAVVAIKARDCSGTLRS